MKLITIQLLVCLIPVFFLSGCGDNAVSGKTAVPVTIIEPEPEVISRMVIAPCRLEASEEAVISAFTPGRVLKINFTEGDFVYEGDVLAELSSDQQYDSMVTASAAGVSAARTVQEKAVFDVERAAALLESGAVSLSEYERLESNATVSESALASAQARYETALAMDESGVITAPFDGFISRVWIREGEMASCRVMSMANQGAMKAALFLSEKHLQDVKAGLPVFFETDHFPGELFYGEVLSRSSSVDPVSGLVSVMVQFDNPEGRLASGMTGTATLALETVEDAVVLPQNALLAVADDSWEAAIPVDGIVEIRTVQIGIQNGTSMEITSGVAHGDLVIVLGNHIVREGEAVSVVQQ